MKSVVMKTIVRTYVMYACLGAASGRDVFFLGGSEGLWGEPDHRKTGHSVRQKTDESARRIADGITKSRCSKDIILGGCNFGVPGISEDEAWSGIGCEFCLVSTERLPEAEAGLFDLVEDVVI